MRILCPLCGFGREMDEAKIPPRAQMATCPKCQHKFRFRVVDDLEPAPEQAPLAPGPGQDLSAGAADPMAAQRAAAAEAWKRLQGPHPASRPDEAGQDAAQPGPDRQESAAEPAVRPEPLNAPEQPAARPASSVPFEDLPSFGFFPGLMATIRMILATPAVFFRAMPRSGGMAKPLVFHLLLSEFMVLCQYIWGVTGIGAVSQYTGSAELMDMGVNMAGASPVLLFVFYPLLLVLRLMVMTGVVHLLLKMLRSASGGPEATFRVICYAAATLVCGIVPFFGPVFGGLWSIGVTVIGLKEVHRTSVSSALFAVLVPILLMLAAVVGLLQSAMKAV